MKINDFPEGLYFLTPKNHTIIAQVKKYNYDPPYYGAQNGWADKQITCVMVRTTDRAGYYIIKYTEKGIEKRRDGINEFRVGKISLKSYLKKLNYQGVQPCQ